MTNEALVAWLRSLKGLGWSREAADRIEALIAEQSTFRKACSDLSQQHIAEWKRAEAAEAKLAKAVEALGMIASIELTFLEECRDIARAALAEIKGESHE